MLKTSLILNGWREEKTERTSSVVRGVVLKKTIVDGRLLIRCPRAGKRPRRSRTRRDSSRELDRLEKGGEGRWGGVGAAT